MSYEGYRQCICPHGHLFTEDAYDHSMCYLCDPPTKAVWTNEVDQTNGPSEGVIPDEEFDRVCQIAPATPYVEFTCPTCGQGVEAKTVSAQPPRYRPPTVEEAATMRRREVRSPRDQKFVYLRMGGLTEEEKAQLPYSLTSRSDDVDPSQR